MARTVLTLALLLTLVAALAPAASAQEARDVLQPVPKELPSQAVIDGREPPKEPDPHLAHLPAGTQPDYAYWRALARARSAARPDEPVAAELPVAEQEPDDAIGVNDTPATAQFVPGLGTGEGEDAQAAVSGMLRETPPGRRSDRSPRTRARSGWPTRPACQPTPGPSRSAA